MNADQSTFDLARKALAFFQVSTATNYSRIEQNNFYANRYHLRLEDFSQAEVQTSDNWLGSSDPDLWQGRVFDRRQGPSIGTLRVTRSVTVVPCRRPSR